MKNITTLRIESIVVSQITRKRIFLLIMNHTLSISLRDATNQMQEVMLFHEAFEKIAMEYGDRYTLN